MRIIHFSRDYTPHDHRFLQKMAATGNEIFYLRLENAGQPFEDRPLPEGVAHIPWAGGQQLYTRKDGPRLLFDLKRVIREYQPDIIQAGPVQTAALLVALAGFKNLVTMSWGYDLLMDVNKSRSMQWATRYTLKRSGAFVGDCQTTANIAAQYGMDRQRMVTFPWGADIQKFSPSKNGSTGTNPVRARKGWGEDVFVLLSTRSWSPLYGVEDLARAYVRAVEKQPELRLLMLGGGPLSSKIHAIIQNAGLLDRVHFPGQINQNELPQYYQAADLYISTSHSDGTSISLLEALASGIPVLLSNIPGNREWITSQGRAGWLFQDGDQIDLEKHILYAAKNRPQLAELGRQARQIAENRGDWDKNFPSLLKAWALVS